MKQVQRPFTLIHFTIITFIILSYIQILFGSSFQHSQNLLVSGKFMANLLKQPTYGLYGYKIFTITCFSCGLCFYGGLTVICTG